METLTLIERAREMVERLNKDDEVFGGGWRYEVEPRGKYAVVVVYDEEGMRVGTL